VDRELTEFTNIDNDSCLLALKIAWHASWHNVEKQMLWPCHLAKISLKTFDILLTISKASKIPGKCNYESCIK